MKTNTVLMVQHSQENFGDTNGIQTKQSLTTGLFCFICTRPALGFSRKPFRQTTFVVTLTL